MAAFDAPLFVRGLWQRFPLVPFSGEVCAAGCPADLAADISDRLWGRSWHDVPSVDWRMIGADLSVIRSCMRPEALRYFWPSLVMAALRSDGDALWAIEALLPSNPRREVRGKAWNDLVAGFDAMQLEVVVAFARHVVDRPGMPVDASYAAADLFDLLHRTRNG